jgi:cysteine dioxygenase
LRETLYSWPEDEKVQKGEGSPLNITKKTVYGENEVTYMSDKVRRQADTLTMELEAYSI